jgi:hypothetical protein
MIPLWMDEDEVKLTVIASRMGDGSSQESESLLFNFHIISQHENTTSETGDAGTWSIQTPGSFPVWASRVNVACLSFDDGGASIVGRQFCGARPGISDRRLSGPRLRPRPPPTAIT